jgi:transcriptional regulator with XRE-family HTH domain
MDRGDETAGSLLRRARGGAGMSQAELAASAGVAQSVISAYEAGRRQPSVPTLVKLIAAAGYDLMLDIQQQPPQRQLGQVYADVIPAVMEELNREVAARVGRPDSPRTT